MLKVKCIDDNGTGKKLKKGEIYEAEEAGSVYIINKEWWSIARFEKIKKEEPQTKLKNNTTILKLINKYGEKQLDIAQEELAELIQAISKYKRIGSDAERQMVVEELVDVKIMLEQLEIMLDVKEYEIDYFAKKKLDRMEERMSNEKLDTFKITKDGIYINGILARPEYLISPIGETETLVMDINKHNARSGKNV